MKKRRVFVATYERNLNEQGAGLYFEAAMNYSNNNLESVKERIASPWWIAECRFPRHSRAARDYYPPSDAVV